MTEIYGIIKGETAKIAIVAARFNSLVTTKLVAGAEMELTKHEVPADNVTVVWVPGALELSRGVKKVAATGKFDGIIALGAVVRGETSHYDFVCSETARGLTELSLQGPVPVMFGVLTTDNMEQALNRAGGKAGNKGNDCANGILEMISLELQL